MKKGSVLVALVKRRQIHRGERLLPVVAHDLDPIKVHADLPVRVSGRDVERNVVDERVVGGDEVEFPERGVGDGDF